jgi:hypothetical protein
MLAIQDRDPVAGLPQAEDEVADFFEMIGYLVSRGHVSARDFWNDARPLVAFYWGVLAPYVEHDRAARRDPRLYRWFEWLEHEMRKIDVRETGRIVAYDPATRSVEIRDRIAKFRSKVLRESEAWPREVAASRTRRRQAVSPAKRPAP